MPQLKICYITTELTPFAKVGGLADVAAALPRALLAAGHDVRVFMPHYGTMDSMGYEMSPHPYIQNVPITLGAKTYTFSLVETYQPGTDLIVFFVHCPALFGRSEIYTSDSDEHLRFLFLSRAAIESCQRMMWAPSVFHCNDWQTALVPLLLKSLYSWDRLFDKSKTLLTIHNMGYQGIFSADILPQFGLDSTDMFPKEDISADRINFLKIGVLYADVLTTVSPTYAQEIQTEAFGMGLDSILRQRSRNLVGVLNGVDYDEWNPISDKLIPYRYSHRSVWRKTKNKEFLLERLGLPYAKEIPLVGMISRLARQKGLDLVFEVLPELLSGGDLRFVILGSGELKYEESFRRLQASFPEKVSFHNGFSHELAHLVEAASDIFLMPSQYEPCGLNQMYSLKYGAIPVVRKTGGLADTVTLYDPGTGDGTGFVFDHYNADGLRWALDMALGFYREPKIWRRLMLNGMSRDFSWETQAQKYVELYRDLAVS